MLIYIFSPPTPTAQEHGMIPSPPNSYEDDLIVFVRTTPQLDKAKIGMCAPTAPNVSLGHCCMCVVEVECDRKRAGRGV